MEDKRAKLLARIETALGVAEANEAKRAQREASDVAKALDMWIEARKEAMMTERLSLMLGEQYVETDDVKAAGLILVSAVMRMTGLTVGDIPNEGSQSSAPPFDSIVFVGEPSDEGAIKRELDYLGICSVFLGRLGDVKELRRVVDRERSREYSAEHGGKRSAKVALVHFERGLIGAVKTEIAKIGIKRYDAGLGSVASVRRAISAMSEEG